MAKEQFASVNHLFRSFRKRLLEGQLQVVQRRVIRGYPHLYGETDFADETIYIKQGLPQGLKEETFVHELLHDHYPNATEEQVEQATPGVYRKLGKNRRGFLRSFLT